ncbi:VOC family protein [Streptomyces sp. NBRC 109706]|uniref:VOC family protein n=1 Tax=Streptomyces sp. NBRC 109706 TaxID=1550035 RepID=UPI0007863193|nr:VOC family protein [Streptomyces sp. NBRC 109706]
MQKIITNLWFDDQAEEAAAFYTSVFDNSRVLETQRYGGAGPREPGSVMTVTFELFGQRFIGLNGGPEFTFNEAISLYVECESQEEVDSYWAQLTANGGQEVECGWLKDKFGVSWQIVPKILTELIADPDPERSQRVMRAMLGMKKIDIRGLEAAYAG